MANPKRDPITDKDLAEFVANDSDFAFEMKVVAQLKSVNFECSHSGTYQDPVTDKIRQFDVRARKHKDSWVLALAVECKNLRPDSPLLLSCVPRTAEEAHHDIIVQRLNNPLLKNVYRIGGDRSVYKPGEMVGKKTDQVRRDKNSGLISDDKETFDKLNQAVNSCRDLVRQLVNSSEPELCGVVVPVLVVPKNTLWRVEYAADGRLLRDPQTVPHASLLLNHTWSIDRPTSYGIISYCLSHLELMTIDALPGIVNGWLGLYGLFQGFQS
jgi:hypothetical protein